MTLSSGQFWFTLFIVLVILLFPVVAIRFYYITVRPTLSDRCRLKQRFLRKKALTQTYDPYIRRKSSAYRSRRSIRSGYAFAHQEGFGQLITSGKIMRKKQEYNLHVPGNMDRHGYGSRPDGTSRGYHHHQGGGGGGGGGKYYKTSSRVQPKAYNHPATVDIN